MSLETLQRRFSPGEVVGRLAFAAGLLEKPEPVAAADLIEDFSWEKVPRRDIPLPAGLFD